jgi:hypothetical protein
LFTAQFDHLQTKLGKQFESKVEDFATWRLTIDTHLQSNQFIVNLLQLPPSTKSTLISTM